MASVIQHYVKGHITEDPSEAALQEMERALRDYARTLTPWARAVGDTMINEVAARDTRSWARLAAQMGTELRREIEHAPIGHVMTARLDDQVKLITSLPQDAAERVRKLATEARIKGTRAADLVADIMRTGEVSASRASTIARTETARTATELTKARAEFVGSEGYIWQTVGDTHTRPSHKKLNGTYHRWDEPPVCDAPDIRAHPGCVFNCRCVPYPILPGDAPRTKH